MPIFYDSLSDHLRDWALCQSLFFVASAPLRGRHINVSPKGLLDSSFAVLGPNQVAYVDLTGSGCETISHIRDNGRVTIMFCSFDKTPRIMRFFGTGSVFEWHEAGFAALCGKMKGVGASLAGSRAIIVVDFFKVGSPVALFHSLISPAKGKRRLIRLGRCRSLAGLASRKSCKARVKMTRRILRTGRRFRNSLNVLLIEEKCPTIRRSGTREVWTGFRAFVRHGETAGGMFGRRSIRIGSAATDINWRI